MVVGPKRITGSGQDQSCVTGERFLVAARHDLACSIAPCYLPGSERPPDCGSLPLAHRRGPSIQVGLDRATPCTVCTSPRAG